MQFSLVVLFAALAGAATANPMPPVPSTAVTSVVSFGPVLGPLAHSGAKIAMQTWLASALR